MSTLGQLRNLWVPWVTTMVLFCFSHAVAQTVKPAPSWTQNNAYQAWEGFKNYFYTSVLNKGDIIAEKQNGNEWSSMWQEAEEIEVAEDAFYWAQKIPGGDTSNYLAHVNNLSQGFIDNMTPAFYTVSYLDWSGNRFNDDLMWASIAFARAYQITGKKNATWLQAAENQFNAVWKRAQAGNGGLIQSQKPTPEQPDPNWVPNEDAPVNFAFVIAGYLIYDNAPSTDPDRESYKDHADTVYAWASANLFGAADLPLGSGCSGQTGLTCVKIFDSNNRSIPNYDTPCKIDPTHDCRGHSDFAYNYGIAIQAAVREAGTDNDAKAQEIANYLMFNIPNTSNYPYVTQYVTANATYNVLPNYGQGGVNDAGYNGIALRGVGLGLDRTILNATTLAWAQANIQAAWDIKNSDNVMWNDWSKTPSAYTYFSWDCSSAVAGMLDIAPPN